MPIQIDAQGFVDQAVAILPGIEAALKMTGAKILTAAAKVLRRVLEYPESRDAVVEWLRYTPIFKGESAEDSKEPVIPVHFGDLHEEMGALRSEFVTGDGK